MTAPRVITGRHVLWAFVAFFGAIAAVNLALAVIAERSWTGLVVSSSHVAGQRFNDHLAAAAIQAELGWRGTLAVDGDRLGFTLVDSEGEPVGIAVARVTLERPVGTGDDPGTITMAVTGGEATLDLPLPRGVWNVRVDATAISGDTFRLDDRITVRDST